MRAMAVTSAMSGHRRSAWPRHPGLIVTLSAASAMRAPCSASSSAARSASVKTFASRHTATRFSRCWLSPHEGRP